MNPELELHFSNTQAPELFRIVVRHPRLAKPRLSVRGKDSGAYHGAGSFQWSSAVRAFALLVSQTAADVARGQKPQPLCGQASSPAQTLDYAMAKNNHWLQDVFGQSPGGDDIWTTVFSRTNAKAKRSGPVSISLRSAYSHPGRILIRWNGVRLESSVELFQLATALERDWYRKNRSKKYSESSGRDSRQQVLGDEFSKRLNDVLLNEIANSLIATDIFSPAKYKQTIAELMSSRSFQSLAGNLKSPVNDLDLNLSNTRRLGMGTFQLDFDVLDLPIRAAIPAPMPGANAIFNYLRDVSALPLAIDSHHVHAVDLAKQIIRREDSALQYDLLCLGAAPAASLLSHSGRTEYEPLMLLPKVSQRIVTRTSATSAVSTDRYKQLNYGEYLLIKDEPSIPSFFLEELTQSGFVRSSRISQRHMEPDEVFAELGRGEIHKKAILFFPHYHFNQWLNGCGFIPDPRSKLSNQDCILFAHKRLLQHPGVLKKLCTAVRHAWIELRSCPNTLTTTVARMNTNDAYSKILARSGGLHHLLDDAA